MAYQGVPFSRFVLAGGIVSVPAFVLADSNPRWAWGYVFLILLMFTVTHYNGLAQAGAYFGKEISA